MLTPRTGPAPAPGPTRRAALAAALLIGLGAVGCDTTPAPTAADESEARKTLEQALAAWQGGKSADALKQASPAIHVSDPNWQKGDALKKFEVSGAGKPAGAEREFTVTLWIADAKGKERKTEVAYRVGTDPILTVFRAMF